MKRITIGLVMVGMLVAAATAVASGALNTYKTSYSFHGSGKSLSFKQVISAKSTTSGNRTALIHDIKTTIAGVEVNEPKSNPTCTAAKIDAAQSDASCPKKALVASGSITASVGQVSPFSQATGQACDPLLDVWNAGQGKLSFFFVDKAPKHECLGGQINTGEVPVFPATYKQEGSKLAVDIPVPNTVDYPAGQSANLTGSLESETLYWQSQTISGKPTIESTSCSGKRSYSWKFTASLPNGSNSISTQSSSASCG